MTFSRNHIQPFKKRLLYESIGTLLLQVLNDCGISSCLNRSQSGELRNPDCFQTLGEYEILSSQGKKLIGSAQVTSRTSCLQHGSIPLNASYKRISRYFDYPSQQKDSQSASIEEETGLLMSFAEMQRRIADSMRNQVECEDSELADGEMSIAQELYRQKYSTQTWNCSH